MRRPSISLALLSLLLLTSVALAQTGIDYDLEWSVLGSTGHQFAASSNYQLGFTLAQDAPPLVSIGSDYQIVQGYWVVEGLVPTSVTLADFWVEAQGNTLMVRWETVSEVDTLGFNIYRSDSDESGSFGRINETLIASQLPGSPVGTDYEWADAEIEEGHTYFYLLEVIDVHGQATEYGPVPATLQPTAPYRSYLPLVNR